MSTSSGLARGGRILGVAAADLPVEGRMASFDGAVAWLNSERLKPEDLRGKVVVVQFWTYTCINWLRTEAYYRAWSQRYRDDGLVTIGVHTPEFKFEHDLDNVRWAVKARKIDYPVAVDSDYEVWQAFDNHYWPALYFVDAGGQIRHHRFGEGDYERSEMVIRQLLGAAGTEHMSTGLASVEPDGDEVQADWQDLGSPESYLGYEQESGFDSPGGIARNRQRMYDAPSLLRINRWSLSGSWIVRSDASALEEPGGRISFQFHARDVNLVMGPAKRGVAIPFRVFLDGEIAASEHGADVEPDGTGTIVQQRMYQLIRQTGPIEDRRFEIEFSNSGAEAFCFTFG